MRGKGRASGPLPFLVVLFVLPFLGAGCSDEGDPPPPSAPEGVESFEQHAARREEDLSRALALQAGRVLALETHPGEIEIDSLDGRTTGENAGRLSYRLLVRRPEAPPAVYAGVQDFTRDPATGVWQTEWAVSATRSGAGGEADPGQVREADPGHVREADSGPAHLSFVRGELSLLQTPGPAPSGSPVEGSPLGEEGKDPFGAHAASKVPDVTLKERAIGFKRPEDSASPALRLLGTEGGERELSPEEKVRWEWIATRPDLSVELIAERTEGPKRTFRLSAIEFPPDCAPFLAVREAAAAALADALSGRLIQVRRDGAEGYQLQTLDGWANLALVRQGLAWLALETGSSLTAIERDELLLARREASEARRGLWDLLDLSGPWVIAGDTLHREGCARVGESWVACPEPATRISEGARLCAECLVR